MALTFCMLCGYIQGYSFLVYAMKALGVIASLILQLPALDGDAWLGTHPRHFTHAGRTSVHIAQGDE
jgi:hypothetical protein